MQNKDAQYKILLAGGGSLGHATPIISVIEEMRNRGVDAEYLFIGGGQQGVKEFVEHYSVEYKSLLAGKLRRYISLRNISDIFKFLAGVVKALFIISSFKPDIVFSKGGYASLPVAIVAGWKKIPLIVHESDSTPGLANKIAAKRATVVCVAFDDMKKYYPGKNVILTGNPVRRAILEGDKEKARKFFNLSHDRPVIFFTTASSSAKNFSRAVIEAAPRLLSRFQIIQQCGSINYDGVQKKLRDVFGEKDLAWDEVDTRIDVQGDRHYCILPRLKSEMADAYAVADVVIGRSSASTAFELAALGKPALFLPLPKKDSRGDQIHNADYFKKRGAAEVLNDRQLNAESLEKKIIEIFDTPGKLSKLSQNIRKLAQPDAAKKISDIIVKTLKNES